MLEKLKNLLFFGGADQDSFQRVLPAITESNRRNVVTFSGIFAVGMLIMLLASFFDASLVKNRAAYIPCAVVCILLLLLNLKATRGRTVLTFGSVYLFIGLVFGFGITLGTYFEPNQMSVSFTVVLFAVPLLFTDRPLRMNIVILTGILVYFYIASLTQDPVMQGYNRSNVLPYGLFSIAVSTYMMQIKVNGHVLELKNKHLIESDQMTGMLNRRSYEQHIAMIRKHGCPPGLKVCAFDVNCLKTVNDNTGHQAGDELIRSAAVCLEGVFSPYGICYRVGGDEFMALLEGEAPEAEELTRRLATVCRGVKLESSTELSISVGIVSAKPGADIDQLIREADGRMYADKAVYYAQAGIDRRKR